MRFNLAVVTLSVVLVLVAGCESTRWNWLKPNDKNEPTVKNVAPPDTTAIVRYLNENAARVRSLRVDEMGIDIALESQTFSLRGRLFAEKPRNFRMKAVLLGKDEVDLGSNSQEFWFWASKNPGPRPYQYFCTYKDLNEGRVQMLPLPIQPEWVMEAMGLGPYGPAEKYQLTRDEQTRMLRLEEQVKSPQGQPVRKVIVMHQFPQTAPAPQVTAYLLVDMNTNQEICSAHITKTIVDRASGVTLPYKMELRMSSQKMKLMLTMGGLTVNSALPPTIFQRPEMKGVDPFNLATGQPVSRDVQRVQGIRLQGPQPN